MDATEETCDGSCALGDTGICHRRHPGVPCGACGRCHITWQLCTQPVASAEDIAEALASARDWGRNQQSRYAHTALALYEKVDALTRELRAAQDQVKESEAEKCDMLRDLERLRVQRDALRADAAVVIRCDALLGVLIVRAIHRLADSEGPQLRGALLSARIEAPLSRRKDGAT